MTPDPDTEARLDALERTVKRWSNPGHLTTPEAVSLKEHFEVRLEAIALATDKASSVLEKRLDGMQAAQYVTRKEMDLMIARLTEVNKEDHGKINDEIAALDRANAKAEGKASMTSVYIAYGFSLLSAALAVVGLFLR